MVVSNIFSFRPYLGPFWKIYFSNGLKPPTSKVCLLSRWYIYFGDEVKASCSKAFGSVQKKFLGWLWRFVRIIFFIEGSGPSCLLTLSSRTRRSCPKIVLIRSWEMNEPRYCWRSQCWTSLNFLGDDNYLVEIGNIMKHPVLSNLRRFRKQKCFFHSWPVSLEVSSSWPPTMGESSQGHLLEDASHTMKEPNKILEINQSNQSLPS